MQPRELSEDMYDVLCDARVPPHEVRSILAKVNRLLLCDEVNLHGIDSLTKYIVDLRANFPKLGEALLSMATNSHKHGDTDIRQETVILLSLVVLCLEPDAITTICEFLRNCDIIEIAEALCVNSLHKLSYTLAMIDPKYYEYNMQLIFAFLVHYPDAYCAQFPDTVHAQKYKLIRALGNALGSDIISGTFLVVNGVDSVLSLKDLAKILLKGLTEDK